MKQSKKYQPSLDIDKYAQIMEEIKRRIEVATNLLEGNIHTMFMATTLESTALQIRMTLELIAMSSLVANQKEYIKVRNKFKNDWNARLIIQELKKINPNFFPVVSISEKPPTNPKHKHDLVTRTDDVLTEAEFIKVYEKCGSLLHADNPLGRKSDYKFYETNLPIWIQKIKNLLNCHKIKLINHSSEMFFLVHMNEKDNKVHVYVFKKNGE